MPRTYSECPARCHQPGTRGGYQGHPQPRYDPASPHHSPKNIPKVPTWLLLLALKGQCTQGGFGGHWGELGASQPRWWLGVPSWPCHPCVRGVRCCVSSLLSPLGSCLCHELFCSLSSPPPTFRCAHVGLGDVSVGGHNATTNGDMGGTQLLKRGGGISGDTVTLLPPRGWVLLLLPGGHGDGDRPCHRLSSHRLYPQALQGAERGPGGPCPQGAGGAAGAGVPASDHLRGGEMWGEPPQRTPGDPMWVFRVSPHTLALVYFGVPLPRCLSRTFWTRPRAW